MSPCRSTPGDPVFNIPRPDPCAVTRTPGRRQSGAAAFMETQPDLNRTARRTGPLRMSGGPLPPIGRAYEGDLDHHVRRRRESMRNYQEEFDKRVAYIRAKLQEAHADGIIFGNSGGKDSALVGILCKAACDNTLGVIMPCASRQTTVRTGTTATPSPHSSASRRAPSISPPCGRRSSRRSRAWRRSTTWR